MTKLVLLIIMLLLMSGFVVPPEIQADVYVCDCMDPVDNIRLCYCARENTVCGNYCEYFYWTKDEDTESYWFMCNGWSINIPMILRGDTSRRIVDS